nr:meiotic recombination protein REC114 [Manis javanica]
MVETKLGFKRSVIKEGHFRNKLYTEIKCEKCGTFAELHGSLTWLYCREGFSLIGSKNWLKIVRRMDCLLFGTTIKPVVVMTTFSLSPNHQVVPLQSHQHPEQQQCLLAGAATSGGRTSVTCLAQSLLASKELPLVYEQSVWNAEEIGPFLRLCLMDQSFPAFVEDVEKNLKKLAGLRN